MTDRVHPFIAILKSYATKENFELSDCKLCQKRAQFPYRLGDMISIDESRAADLARTVSEFPDSIVAEYANRTSKSCDYEVLADIVRKRGQGLELDTNICVVNLRVGDVIDAVVDTGHEPEDISRKRLSSNGKRWGNYTPPFDDIIEGLRKISAPESVTIIAGTHSECNQQNSCRYIQSIERMLRDNGYKVSLRLGNDADVDYVLMCLASGFVSSGGTYSRSILRIRGILGTGKSYDTRDQKILE